MYIFFCSGLLYAFSMRGIFTYKTQKKMSKRKREEKEDILPQRVRLWSGSKGGSEFFGAGVAKVLVLKEILSYLDHWQGWEVLHAYCDENGFCPREASKYWLSESIHNTLDWSFDRRFTTQAIRIKNLMRTHHVLISGSWCISMLQRNQNEDIAKDEKEEQQLEKWQLWKPNDIDFFCGDAKFVEDLSVNILKLQGFKEQHGLAMPKDVPMLYGDMMNEVVQIRDIAQFRTDVQVILLDRHQQTTEPITVREIYDKWMLVSFDFDICRFSYHPDWIVPVDYDQAMHLHRREIHYDVKRWEKKDSKKEHAPFQRDRVAKYVERGFRFKFSAPADALHTPEYGCTIKLCQPISPNKNEYLIDKVYFNSKEGEALRDIFQGVLKLEETDIHGRRPIEKKQRRALTKGQKLAGYPNALENCSVWACHSRYGQLQLEHWHLFGFARNDTMGEFEVIFTAADFPT